MTISIAHDFTLIGLDCMLRPDMCGPNASCKETNKKVGKQWNYHQCVCNPGFVGNGITCIDASDLADPDTSIEDVVVSDETSTAQADTTTNPPPRDIDQPNLDSVEQTILITTQQIGYILHQHSHCVHAPSVLTRD